jgi:D-glycero-alpha-D-manno-heptose-7-phosphate kinase
LREAAVAARDAVVAQDLGKFGQAMIANTEAQRALHPGLVGADAGRVVDLAAAHGALGWKVNGAGGDGGSLTILSATARARSELEQRVTDADERYRVLPMELSAAGLRVRGAL